MPHVDSAPSVSQRRAPSTAGCSSPGVRVSRWIHLPPTPLGSTDPLNVTSQAEFTWTSTSCTTRVGRDRLQNVRILTFASTPSSAIVHVVRSSPVGEVVLLTLESGVLRRVGQPHA